MRHVLYTRTKTFTSNALSMYVTALAKLTRYVTLSLFAYFYFIISQNESLLGNRSKRHVHVRFANAAQCAQGRNQKRAEVAKNAPESRVFRLFFALSRIDETFNMYLSDACNTQRRNEPCYLQNRSDYYRRFFTISR